MRELETAQARLFAPEWFPDSAPRGLLHKTANFGDARQSISPASAAHFVSDIADGFVIGIQAPLA
jgi:hypothetical protein